MTVELWAFRTGTNPIMHLVGKRSNCGPDRNAINYQLALNNASGEGVGFGAAITRRDIPLNTWTHLIGTFDGTTFRVYINGELAGFAAGTNGPVNTSPLLIGGSGGCDMFIGRLDEVSIYSRALSAAEVQAIFSASVAGKCRPGG